MKTEPNYIEQTLQFIAKIGYQNNQKNFIKNSIKFLADLLKVDYVLVGKYSVDTPNIVETISVYGKGKYIANIEYELEGTPCENVISKKLCVYPNNIQTLFPKDDLLVKMDVNSYIGMPLWTSNSEPIGLIAILDKNPITNSKTIETIIQMVAIKLEEVLEKIQYDKKIKLKMNALKEAKIKAEENKEKFKKLSNLSFEGILIHKNGTAIDVNVALTAMFGYKTNELIGKNVIKLLFPKEYHETILKNIHKNYIFPYEIEGKKKDGTLFPVEIEARIISQKSNNNIRVAAIRDLSFRKQSQLKINEAYKTIKEKEHYLSTILHTAEEGFWVIDKQGITVEVNPKMCKILEYTQNEMLGKSIFDFVDEENAKIFKEQLKKRELGISSNYEITLIKKDKQKVHCLFKTSPLFNNEKSRVGSFAMVTDISNLKNTYKNLENLLQGQKRLSEQLAKKNNLLLETQSRYVNLFEQSPVSLWEEDFSEVKKLIDLKKKKIKDLNTYFNEHPKFLLDCIKKIKIIKVNQVTLNLFGVKNEQELTRHIRSTNTKKSLEVLQRELVSIFSNKREFNDEAEFITTTGKVITTIIKSTKVGATGKAIVSVIDITSLKNSERKILESEQLLNESQKIAQLGSYSLSFKTGLWESSPILNNLFGIDTTYKKDVAGWLAIVHPKDRKMMQQYFEINILQNHEFFNKIYRIRRMNDGVERWMHGFGKLEFNNAGVLMKMIGTIQDITAQKQVELELQGAKSKIEKSEKKFRELYEKSGDAILIIKNGVFIDCNFATIKMLGYKSKEAFLNSHPSELSPAIQSDGESSMKKAEKMMDLALKNGTHRFEWLHVKKNGKVFPVEVLLTAISNEPKNKIIHCVWRDITNRKKAETEIIKAKEKAEESNRLKTEFLNNMSHEIRTPLNGILGFSELLSSQNLTHEKRNNFIKIIQNSGQQLLTIINDILEISELETKQVTVKEEKVVLNNVLFELFSIFDKKAYDNRTPLYLKNNHSDSESTILIDKSKLIKILSNLLDNAIKYTNEGNIEFGYNIIDFEKAKAIELYVKDTGIGIHQDKHKIIFERFSQGENEITKKTGGLGLGLSIAKENTELLGGKISLVSKKWKGATFFVTIPYKPYLNSVSNVSKNNEDKLLILIAEDEEVNYLFLEILLKEQLQLNCELIHAKNGQEAVQFFELNPAINYVLMDIKMPKMNGYEATQKIKELNPSIPVIAQTAYSTKEDKKKALNAGCDDFLSKPIKKEALQQVLTTYIAK